MRIAILDTGFACSTEEQKKKTRSFSDKVKRFESFLENAKPGDGEKDEIGHGTAVAYQLTRVCPNAELYIGRVGKLVNNEWTADSGAVVRALEKACDPWGVDIINMSFGWEDQDDKVHSALSYAQDKGILLYASVSNFGVLGNNNILYPARSPYVIPVDAADGLGEPASTNSSSESGLIIERFTAPGVRVKGPIGSERVSGTSLASPIAAGIAALVLEFARQPPLGCDKDVTKYLKRKDGMVGIFRLMQNQKTSENFKFLCPWYLLSDKKGTYGGNGEPSSRRYYVARRIIEDLRREFGPSIGEKVLLD